MAVRYIDADIALSKAVSFRFALPGGLFSVPIEFQFPPKILNDGRKAEWVDANVPAGNPVSVYAKTGPREISLSFTYIVDGDIWSTTKISNIIRELRGYFGRANMNIANNQRDMIVMFKMWLHGGVNEMSCKLNNVVLKHSETVVMPCRAPGTFVDSVLPSATDVNLANLAYPLRTDVSIDLRIWSLGGPPQDAGQNIPNLVAPEPIDWY